MAVKLVWVTPDAERMIADIARVSSPKHQGRAPAPLLLALMAHGHWSPFEMASMCVEIRTTRDVSRQILRHRSFCFQEFSQRWSSVTEPAQIPACRVQNPEARELPLECEDGMVAGWWDAVAHKVSQVANQHYEEALAKGVSREVARALLPEGLTPTRLYVSGTFRSWIHYLQLRLKPDTQKEHRDVAREIQLIFAEQAPAIWSAACC